MQKIVANFVWYGATTLKCDICDVGSTCCSQHLFTTYKIHVYEIQISKRCRNSNFTPKSFKIFVVRIQTIKRCVKLVSFPNRTPKLHNHSLLPLRAVVVSPSKLSFSSSDWLGSQSEQALRQAGVMIMFVSVSSWWITRLRHNPNFVVSSE